jgi:prepilin-type processing-associated H-X9-DG protein
VIVVIAILVGLVIPILFRPRLHTKLLGCTNNLKQVGLAYRIFANDNEDKLPWQFPANQGGSREFMETPFSAFQHFRVMSNELSTPKVLVCPKDRQRTWATNFSALRGNQALSYFVGFDSSETNPPSLLSGDRYLGSSRAPTNGFLTLTVASTVWWTNSPHPFGGNLVFGDGSVQAVDSRGLLKALRNTGVATNRLALPLLGP